MIEDKYYTDLAHMCHSIKHDSPRNKKNPSSKMHRSITNEPRDKT